VQERLKTAGFYPGPVDGFLGPRTRDALRRFQETKGLEVTGEADKATRKALELD
jgi:peptidoglycan hydrolase-like protein with peptidoglycan-binding domain